MHWTPELDQKLRELRLGGKRISDIASIFQTYDLCVKRRVKELKIVVPKSNFWTPERLAIALQMWTQTDRSAKQIGRVIGCSRTAVIGKMNRMGKSRKYKAKVEEKSRASTWTQEEIATLTAMWQEGKSSAEIARTLGKESRMAVISLANRLNLERGIQARHSVWSDEKKRQLVRLWLEGLTDREIAKRIGGVTRRAVTSMRRRLQLHRPRHKIKNSSKAA